MKPSLSQEAGGRYKVAVLLLAPLFACLSKEELETAIDLIKSSSLSQISDASKAFEKSSSVAVAVAQMTRFSGQQGMSEVSDIVSLAGKYMDINQIMPPEGSKWKPTLIEELLPDGVNAALDGMSDFFMGLTVPISKEYSVQSPVDMVVDSPQTPGYVNGLFSTLESNIQSVEFGVSETAQPGETAAIGWREILITMLGAAAVAGIGYAAISALIKALSDDGLTTSTVTRDQIVEKAKELGIDVPTIVAAVSGA